MIIPSLLDTDLYKFTMMQVVLHHFPGAQVEYRFKCRNPDVDLTPYVAEIRDEIRALCDLRFTRDELDYLRRWRFFKSDFVDLLGPVPARRALRQGVAASPDSPREIDITIKGPWLHTILFEVPVLAIVSEVYYRDTCADAGPRRRPAAARREDRADQRGRRARLPHRRLRHAPALLARLARGGRRARSRRGIGPQVRRHEQRRARACAQGLTPLGTMAHEYLQACQAVGPRLRDSQALRVQHVGARVPRRPRDRAVRRLRAWTRSCATSTSSSASCSTACATTRAIRSSGARS